MFNGLLSFCRWIPREVHLLHFSAVLLFLPGCAGSKMNPSHENLAVGSAQFSDFSAPQAVAFNFSNDSCRIHFDLPEDYLLFVRSDSAFLAKLEIEYGIYPDARSKQPIDTGSVQFNLFSAQPGKAFSGFFDFKFPSKGSWLLRLAFIDQNTKKNHVLRLPLRREASTMVQQDFLLNDLSGQVVKSNALPVKMCVNILAPSLRSDSVWVRWYFKRFPLPSLPFRVIPDPVFSLIGDTAYAIPVEALGDFCLFRHGVCYIQQDTLSAGGCAIVVCDEDFPKVTVLDQLIEGTRYLTTKSEFRDLNRPGDRKMTFDGFWLEAGGSAERARRLIRSYYNRMQKANRRFTSYTDGWRTDRGMVFMVLGEPQTVYNDGESEQWNYPAWPGTPDRYFIFRKMNNPFTENDYALIRQPNLEWSWYHAVDQWRNGRIPDDD